MWKNKRHLLLLLPVRLFPLPLLLPLLFPNSSYPSIRSCIRPACLFCVIFSAYGSKHGEFHQLTIFFTTWKQMNVYNMLCSNTVTVAKSKTKTNQKKEKKSIQSKLKEWPDDWLCSVFYIQISLRLGIKWQKNEKCWVLSWLLLLPLLSQRTHICRIPNDCCCVLHPVSKTQINTCYVKANAF